MPASSEVSAPLLDSSDKSDSLINSSNNRSNNQSVNLSINDDNQYIAPSTDRIYSDESQTNGNHFHTQQSSSFPTYQSTDQTNYQQHQYQQDNSSFHQQFDPSLDQTNNQHMMNNQSFNQPQYLPLYQAAPHLRHLYRERQLPPYQRPIGFKDLWSNYLSRGTKFFIILIICLWLLMFISNSLRLVALFLPFLFVPALIFGFIVNQKFLNDVEVNLLFNQFIMGFSAIALCTLIIETLLTVVFACITLLPFQYDEVKAWFDNQIDQANNQSNNSEMDMFEGFSRTVPFFIFIFLLSFCVAGCVEEGAKGYLGLRIKKITPGYSNKNGLIIYLIAGALGFSTFENIAYATAVTTPAVSVFVNVLTRAFISTPLHLCCSYLVAVGIVRRDIFGHSIGWFRIFLLPVLLHGGFDFALIICSAVIDPESTLIIILDCVIVLCTFLFIGITIYFERKHIEGQSPVLPIYDQSNNQSNNQYEYQSVNGVNNQATQLAAM